MEKEAIIENDSNLVFPHIYAIDASAGAGKTTCLSQRYLQFLLSEKIKTKFKNLAAITFTNKAANEMKKRVIESLKKIALGYEDEILKLLPLVTTSQKSMIEKAEEIIEDMLKHYSDLNIGTIDSFINSIIRSSAIESGVSPDFDVTMEPERIVEYALDILLEELENSDSLRSDFDDFLLSYLVIEEKSGWYPRRELLKKINLLRKKENENGITFYINQLPNIKIEEIIESIRDFLSQCERLKLPLLQNANKGINKFIESGKAESKYLMHDDALNLFSKNSMIPEKIIKLWADIKKNLSDYYRNKAILIFRPYLKMKKILDDNLERIKYEKGMVFIDELNAYVKNLIDNFDVPYIYYKFGEEINHYLIDEFQDTNEIQWENIKNLVLNSLSEGGSLFYVGDKKQAIYRFRGGKSELFDEVLSDNELSRVTEMVYKKNISENRRSKKAIIDFNNSLFSVENLSQLLPILKDDINIEIFNEMLRKTYSNVKQEIPEEFGNERAGGFVFTKSIMESSDVPLTAEEIEDTIKEQLIRDITDVLSRRGNADIAVIVRTNTDVKRVTGWLLEKKIDTISESAGDLREHPLIREIISFLKFLNDPLDNLAFAGFLCGDIFTSATHLKREEIYNWLNKLNVKNVILYKKFMDWNNIAWNNYIDYFFKNAGFLPPYDIITTFLDRFRVFSIFQESSGFLIHFLETIRKFEENGKNNVEEIIREWDKKDNNELFSVPLNFKSGAVNVMTIHKAKGLEFSVVIIPFAGISCKTDNEILLKETNEIAFADKEIRNFCSNIQESYSVEKTKSLIDEINVLYVGCTRAKDELYIYAPPKVGPLKNMLLDIPPFSEQDEMAMGEKIKVDIRNEFIKPAGLEFLSSPVKSNWTERFYGLISREELIESFFLRDDTAIKKGNLIHKILSTISRFNEIELKKRIKSLNESEELKNEIEEKVRKIISNELLKRYFSPTEGMTIYCEVDVIDEAGNTKRIDRLVIENDSVTLLDFKTGSRENISRDKKQIKEYIDLIRKVYPDRGIRGLIIYLEPFMVVEVK